MGTWGTGILSGDFSSDVYDDFFNLYNEGISVKEITDILIRENLETIANHPPDACEFWFVIALAQWECKALEESVFIRVKSIIESRENLQHWKEANASSSDIKKREKVLIKFLDKLQTGRKTAKKIRKKTLYTSIFKKGDCLTYIMKNGNYGGALVLTDEQQTICGTNFIAITTIDQKEKPTVEDFKKSDVYVKKLSSQNQYFLGDKLFDEEPQIAGFDAYLFKRENVEIEITGNLKVYKEYEPGNRIKGYGWGQLTEIVPQREELEKIYGKPKTRIKLSEWLTKRWF
jgi:hypothetical protein